jgi:hypothetical protein
VLSDSESADQEHDYNHGDKPPKEQRTPANVWHQHPLQTIISHSFEGDISNFTHCGRHSSDAQCVSHDGHVECLINRQAGLLQEICYSACQIQHALMANTGSGGPIPGVRAYVLA